jgi:hypothetical protein
MQRPRRHNHLLELAFKAVKYFLLGVAGCTIAYVIALVLGWLSMAMAIAVFFEWVLVRSLVLLGCLWAIAVINESTRY